MRKLWRRGGLFQQVLEHQNFLHQVLEQSSQDFFPRVIHRHVKHTFHISLLSPFHLNENLCLISHFSALMFTLSVITMIGYGNTVPRLGHSNGLILFTLCIHRVHYESIVPPSLWQNSGQNGGRLRRWCTLSLAFLSTFSTL